MAQSKASSIGWMFVPQYYTFVNKDPAKLHCFYTKESSLIHGVEGEDCQPCLGQQEIHEKIMSLGFEDCKVFVSTVDSQSSAENGIVVQVVGELSNKGGPWRKFAQTFFLAEQPNGYFVLNDIFRYIKEDTDEEEVPEDIATTENPTAPADVLASLDQPLQTQASTQPHAHHDFELAQAHGTPEDAAGVTFVPPPVQQGDESTRANLEGLVNGDAQQEQVVELRDDLNEQASQAQEQQESVTEESPVDQEQPNINGTHEGEEQVEPVQETEAQAEVTQPDASANQADTEQEALAEDESDTVPAASQQEEASQTATADASNAAQSQATTSPPESTQSPVATPAAPAKPAAPKSWASLAATNTNKWKTQVLSEKTGVSSTGSGPASSSASVTSGASTPASSAPVARSNNAASSSASTSNTPRNGPSTSGSASEKANVSSDGFITAGPRERNNRGDRSGDVDRQQTRTPNFTNVETGHSAIIHNVRAEMSHSAIRQRVSDEFANIHAGNRKEWAKLSYLDIDRSKSLAYIDFEQKWALDKAVAKGECTIDGTICKVTGGKGNRRDATGHGAGSRPEGRSGGGQGGKGRGSGQSQSQQPQGGERRPAGPGGQSRQGQNGARGSGARIASGKAQ